MDIGNIACLYLSILHRRSQYLSDKISIPFVSQYVVSSLSLVNTYI